MWNFIVGAGIKDYSKGNVDIVPHDFLDALHSVANSNSFFGLPWNIMLGCVSVYLQSIVRRMKAEDDLNNVKFLVIDGENFETRSSRIFEQLNSFKKYFLVFFIFRCHRAIQKWSRLRN